MEISPKSTNFIFSLLKFMGIGTIVGICLILISVLWFAYSYGGGFKSSHSITYEMDCSREELTNCLHNFKKIHEEYALPKSLRNYEIDSLTHTIFMGREAFYFDGHPTEIYQVGLTKNYSNDDSLTSPSYVGIRYVVNTETRKLRSDKSYWSNIFEAQDERFKKEILAVMKSGSCGCALTGKVLK
jgi:hypothetical protein